MEDFLKFLFIAGVILVGIFKEVSKNSKSEKTAGKRPVPTIPPTDEIEPDTIPMPESWGRPKSMEELLRPISVGPQASQRASRKVSGQTAKQQQQQKKKKKKREEVSVAASLANSAAQDELNSRQGAHFGTLGEPSDNNEDFTIQSAEEARRAIIWGEILQRKY